MPTRTSRRAIALAAAALAFNTLPAGAAVSGILYEGLGMDVLEIAPGVLGPVGYVNPSMAYPLPNGSGGGTSAGLGMGLGMAQYSSGTAILGTRGMVMTAAGAYALGTLGANSVGGWTPLGSASSSAQATNASGLVVGTSTLYSADGTQNLGGRAVYYEAGSSTPNPLAMPGGFTDSSGFGIAGVSNMASSGIIIGFANQMVGDASTGARALRWSSKTATPQVLGSLPGLSEWGDNNSSAVAVNAAGTTVGSGNTFSPTGQYLGTSAVRWNANTTTATALGHLGTGSDGTYNSSAVAVNDAGTVVGNSVKYTAAHADAGNAALRWAAGTTVPIELGALGQNADGASYSDAVAVNSAGTTLGSSLKFTRNGRELGSRAVTWAAGATAPTELGLLSVGATGESYSYAFDINDAGWAVGVANIVGTMANTYGDPSQIDVHAVVWTPDGAVIDLNSLLPSDSPWTLTGAYSISDSGWITGIGWYQPEGYSSDYIYSRLYSIQLAMPVPEPTSAALFGLGLGVAALAVRRRRERQLETALAA